MDSITYIKKEEPVEYVLTADDQGKVQDLTIPKEVTEKFSATIKQELNSCSGSENENIDKAERNKGPFKIFQCDKCSVGYKSLRTLHKHIQNHNRQDKVQCKICKGFYNTSQLPLHIQIHTGPPYNCPICLKKFEMIHSWKKHCRIMHREKTFKCEKCQRSFLQKHALMDHMQTHEEREKSFTCKECGVCFYREESFTRHLSKQHSHIPRQLYKCSNTACNKIFRTNRFFQSHVCRKKGIEKLPKRIKYLSCTTCLCDFSTKKAFKDHQKMHRREQRTEYLTCSTCQSQFFTKKDLIKHQSLHQEDRRELIRKRKNMHAKRRNCEQCNRNFKITDASYQLHLAQHCPDKIMYECDNCSRLFYGKFAILAHLSQAHKNHFECECGSAFTKKEEIVEHILLAHSPNCFEEDEKGTFTCLRCSKAFVDVELYLEHMQEGHCAYKFKCTLCDKRFPSNKALKRHAIHHLRYSCAHCGRSYHNKNSLKVHMQRGEHNTTFVCKFCHKVFLNKGSRNTHSLYHCPKNSGKVFLCDICKSVKYTKKADIIKHMLVTHSPKTVRANDDGSFTCGRCKAVFVGKDYFLNHVHLRNCVKKIQCEKCSRVMTHSRYDVHDCGQHNSESRAFKCELCDSTFKTSYTLLMHMRRGEHRTSFECEYCHKVFSGKGSYMSHYKNFCKKNKPQELRPELPTNFECKLCDRKFDNLGSYLTHCKFFCKMNQPDVSDNESGNVVVTKLPVVPIYKNLYGDY
ncbi:gastrula zinc finger protein XlCGF58.1-like isoform X2 [Bradysia coprophila]|uniref:gastrula zinc finger protein XlCGF58.1-like isoform X2 n=1 Tax=Bradysia coprophila TaxID=38358 RepID=UPI00187DB416|nr:gastrula zinc finger protein XlCGF58.1-like isoform X2 [Bradysia coprophila]